MGHVCFAECESLFAHLIAPITKQVDNELLAIDLSALKQLIWDNRGDRDEEVDGSKGDYPRWIDTSAMLSDCLTQTMTSCRLTETLSTGTFDMRPSEESLATKAKNRKWRALKKEQERLQDSDTWNFSCSFFPGELNAHKLHVWIAVFMQELGTKNTCPVRFRSCEAAEYVENVKSVQY